MLTTPLIETILATIPNRTVGLIGDLFLDRYFDIDAGLNEPSVETGLTAYQVTGVRCYPGALGTVLNNLAALGVGRIHPITVIGDDGEGYELRKALAKLRAVVADDIVVSPDRRTPTYSKPMLNEAGSVRELNRLDIKNRTGTPAAIEDELLRRIDAAWDSFDAVIVLDQVSEAECGVVTTRVRERLAELGERDPVRLGSFRSAPPRPCGAGERSPTPPELAGEGALPRSDVAGVRGSDPSPAPVAPLPGSTSPPPGARWGIPNSIQCGRTGSRFVLADSRERIGLFRNVCVKPNMDELMQAVNGCRHTKPFFVRTLANIVDRTTFCTYGPNGIYVSEPDPNALKPVPLIPAYPVTGPIDICGAGDSCSAGITCAMTAGATPEQAAAFGNLIASITVQQIGITGTATPDQVRARWHEVSTK